MIQRWIVTVLALVLTAGSAVTASAFDVRGIAGAAQPSSSAAERARVNYGSLPLIFERARETPDAAVRFLGRSGRYVVGISAGGVRFAAPGTSRAGHARSVALEFIGADRNASVHGVDLQETRIHRLQAHDAGDDDVDIPTYARVRVSGAYPNVELVFYGYGGQLEYDVVVSPGGDPSQVAFHAEGAAAVSIDDAGALLLESEAGTLTVRRPMAYQDIDGRRIGIESSFVLDADFNVRIRVGSYDPARTLVIDPIVTYATYLGGNSFEQGTGIAVDANGNAYVTGYTLSTDFPTATAFDRSLGKSGDVDVFVSKLNAAGTGLVWSTYLGGAGSIDRAIGIAVDVAGSAYITGHTAGSNFPVTANAWQKAITDGGAFVAKLGPAGSTLAYSTYVAGATSSAIAVDRNGSAHVTGSATPTFTTTPGALRRTSATASGTGFVLKLDATGSAPVYATFLGGSGSDYAASVAVDVQGNAYVGGWTTSSDFPLAGAIQSSPRGGKDAFVAKLDATGARLLYSTLLGGALDDAVNAIAVDGAGYAYVAGETYSTDFPSKGGFQPQKAGARLVNSSSGNAFVAKIAPSGNTLVYSSFLGGEVCTTLCELVFGPQPQFRADAAYGIGVDASGHAYVTGIARSYTFPLVDSAAPRKREDNEDSAFVTKVSASGSALLWSTFLRTGFNEADNGWTRFPPGAATGVAIDQFGAAYVTGDADSSSNFLPTPGAFQTTNENNQGAVVVKFAPTPSLSLTTSAARVDAHTPVELTATLAGPAASGNVAFMDGGNWIGGAPLVANRATLNTTLPVGIHALHALLRVPGIAADTPLVYQVVDPPPACD